MKIKEAYVLYEYGQPMVKLAYYDGSNRLLGFHESIKFIEEITAFQNSSEFFHSPMKVRKYVANKLF